MNNTYLMMSIPSIVLAVGLTALATWKFGLRLTSLALPIAVLLATTAVFDNLIIGAGLVAYDESRILGLYIGLAPIEDFLYAIVAVMLAASLWHILRRKESR
jgi:lycopene cyclase domain-containing protein